MSLRPRHPLVPGMPPVITQGYGFTPVGMMQMQPRMGVMTPSVISASPLSSQAQNNHRAKKLIPQDISKEDNEKPPVTTVFVGNISERAPDAMIKQMLQRCGNVLSWKRVQGASGKLQAFGFCEFDNPEATWRCIRLVNEWLICDKKLVVKVDAKTKALLDEYKEKKKARHKSNKKEEGEADDSGDDEELDEFTLREDRVARAGLDAIMREYSDDLSREPPSAGDQANRRQKKVKEDKEVGLDDMELEDDKKDLINREIKFFRDSHKDDEEKEERRDRDFRERERERRRREEREREYERERERERRDRERERLRRERERTRSRSRSRDRSRESNQPPMKTSYKNVQAFPARHREKRERDMEEEEEIYEKKKLERKLREKESAYQERLKNWEARERKKAREYEKELEKENERKSEENKEARRLKEFLEDYDDDRDDPKFYKGSALLRRQKEREKESEADSRDRQREREEIEEIRRKLLEEGHPDPEAEVARIEEERCEHLRPRLKLPLEPVVQPMPEAPASADSNNSAMEPAPSSKEEIRSPLQPVNRELRHMSAVRSSSDEDNDDMGPGYDDDEPEPFIGPVKSELDPASLSSPAELPAKRKKMTVTDMFNNDDDEEETKRRKLTLPDSMEQSTQGQSKVPTTAEEKRSYIKNLIEQIPTGKEELFAYNLDWNMVDKTLMDKRIKPWVNKKIIEYIGDEEITLTEFICQKVMMRSTPQNILNDVAMILDAEAEVFVVKMWRLLIYETEAKKAGLVK